MPTGSSAIQSGFEERYCGLELELAAYTDEEPPPGAVVEDVEPGWEERWRDFHRPVQIGPFWVGPPWQLPPRDATALVIDPGQAFGTGAHATTQLCIELVAEQEPSSLVDVGCGSGVIAIAAALLGFAPVVAVDVDPAALDATARNAAANGVTLDVRQLDLVTRCAAGRRRRRGEHLPRARRCAADPDRRAPRHRVRLSRPRPAAPRSLSAARAARPRRLGS